MSHSFSDMALAVVASYTGRDRSFAARVDYWVSFFEHKDLTTITTDDVEDGVDTLVKRGKIKVLTTSTGVTKTLTGVPLSPSTINRHVACLGTIFKELKRRRLLINFQPASTVSLLELGEQHPSLITLFKIAPALGVTPSEIVRRTELLVR